MEIEKIYSVKDVSIMLNVPAGTIRQWEKDLTGVLEVPRDANGYRYFTDKEIEIIRNVKTLRDKGLSLDSIREVITVSKPQSIEPIHTTQQLTIEDFKTVFSEIIRNEVASATESLSEQVASLSEQLRKQGENIDTFISETRSERHKKKSIWNRLFS